MARTCATVSARAMINYLTMLKLITFVLTATIILSCASTPNAYPDLEEAKSSLAVLNAKAEIKEIASVTLFQAGDHLKNAEQALKDKKLIVVDHHIYLSKRKQEMAQELLLKHQHEQELANLKQQHQEMVEHARNLETKRALNEAELAQQHAKKLEHALGIYQAEETSRGTLLVINDLLFASGGTKLEPASANKLRPLLQYLQGNPKREIIIEGHTDSVGHASQNKHLSQLRAETVKTFLITNGVTGERIEARGFGEEAPVATNTTNAGRRLNRRVEIIIKTIVHEKF